MNTKLKEIIDIIDGEIKRVFNTQKIGELMFLYRDTYGLSKDNIDKALFICIKRFREGLINDALKYTRKLWSMVCIWNYYERARKENNWVIKFDK